MKWIPVFVLLAAVFCTNSYGQDCSNVIALSKTVNTVVSDKREVEQNAANFCSEYSRHRGESSTYNFGASFKFLSASFEGGSASVDEVASKYCSASDYSRAKSDVFNQYVESIAPGAYRAYEQCLRLTNQDVKFNVDVASVLPKEFSLTTSFSSTQGLRTTTIAYESSADVTCTWDGQSGNSKTINTGTSSILKCTRPNQATRSYVTVVWTGSGAGQTPLTLPWQAYNSSGIPVNSLALLTQTVAGLRNDLTRNLQSLQTQAVRIASGSVSLGAEGGQLLSTGSGERRYRVHVNFPNNLFATLPQVLVGLNSFDLSSGTNQRLEVNTTEVTTSGFDLYFRTWGETHINWANAVWIAHSK